MIQARQINLEDWVLSGGGNQGDSYHHKTDNNLLLKLFIQRVPLDIIIDEVELTRNISEAGVKCPKPGELVKAGDRYGIIFQRIPNKKSFCRAIGDDPSCIADMARRQAVLAHELHAKSSEGTPFISVIDWYSQIRDILEIDDFMSKQLDKAFEIVRQNHTPTLIHGDFHFGNIITDGTNDYLIDLGAFAYGNPHFDNSMQYFISHFTPVEILEHDHHISKAQALEFWDEYKAAYYGPDAPSDEELEHEFVPYWMLRMLFFLRDVGHNEKMDILVNMITDRMAAWQPKA